MDGRRLVVNDEPVVTGLVTVGDSACCTNPSLGGGITVGLMHAAGTVEVIGKHLDARLTLAAEHDRMTQPRVIPWYQATVEFDRARKTQLDAAIEGRPAPQPAGPGAALQQALGTAMLYDPDIFRAMMEIITMQARPAEVLARPGFASRVMAAAEGREVMAAAEGREAFVPPSPSRAELIGMLA